MAIPVLKTFEDERAIVRVHSSDDRAYWYSLQGWYTVPALKFVCAEWERCAARRVGPFATFADFIAMDGYETQVRVDATAWFNARRDRFDPFAVLVRSKLVAMGVTTMAMMSGLKLKSFSNPAQFSIEVNRALRGERSIERRRAPF